MFSFENYLTPHHALFRLTAMTRPHAIKSLPARFDASGLVTEQFEATSKDGTKIPYFVTRPKNLHGPAPTVLYGYGGFEISLTPATPPISGGCGSPMAASMWWPISAAAASSARPGMRRR